MNDFGHYTLALAWLLTLMGFVACLLGFSNKPARLEFSRRCLVASAACSLLAVLALAYGFATDDFSNQYIWEHSNRDMQFFYKLSAVWGGMDGSLLLWGVMLAGAGAVLARRLNRYSADLHPWLLGATHSSLAFILSLVLFHANPFRYIQSPFVPPDGNGLNPLLQNPFMVIHPPLLYLGFTAQVIPFAFAIAVLATGFKEENWFTFVRPYALWAWMFLTAGIVLGAAWAYLELGWGGFWAWDPVENASLLPWLTATAFLHGLVIEERRGMLRRCNASLAVFTYALTIFGTFVTRSGAVQSVHSFAPSGIGWVFLLYLGLVLFVWLVLLLRCRSKINSSTPLKSWLSREILLSVTNLLLLGVTFAILWGMVFPLLSGSFGGQKQIAGVPYYNSVTVPIFMLLLLVLGFKSGFKWGANRVGEVFRKLVLPLSLAILIVIVLFFLGVQEFKALLCYGLVALAFFSLSDELLVIIRNWRGSDITNVSSGKDLYRRIGAALSHLGFLVLCIGICASLVDKQEFELTMSPKEIREVGGYKLKLLNFFESNKLNYRALNARVVLSDRNSRAIGEMAPEMRSYGRDKQNSSEVAINSGLLEDVYLVLAGFNEDGSKVTFKMFINPLQVWVWIGGLLMITGVGVLLWKSSRA